MSIAPEVGSIRRRINRPVVDLPQPDSPTSASVSPSPTSKSMPSTARTAPLRRPRIPLLTGKYLTSFATRSSGFTPAPAHRLRAARASMRSHAHRLAPRAADPPAGSGRWRTGSADESDSQARDPLDWAQDLRSRAAFPARDRAVESIRADRRYT